MLAKKDVELIRFAPSFITEINEKKSLYQVSRRYWNNKIGKKEIFGEF